MKYVKERIRTLRTQNTFHHPAHMPPDVAESIPDTQISCISN